MHLLEAVNSKDSPIYILINEDIAFTNQEIFMKDKFFAKIVDKLDLFLEKNILNVLSDIKISLL